MSWESINRRTADSNFRLGVAGTVKLVGGVEQPCRVVIWRDAAITEPDNTGLGHDVKLTQDALGVKLSRLNIAAPQGAVFGSGDLWLGKRNGAVGAVIKFTPPESGQEEIYTVEHIIKRELTILETLARVGL